MGEQSDRLAPASPDHLQLRGTPTISARLNNRAVLAAIALAAGVLGIIVLNVSRERPKPAEESRAKKELAPALGAARSLTKDVPDAVSSTRDLPVLPSLPSLAPQAASPSPHVDTSAEDARTADTALTRFTNAAAAGAPPVAGLATTATAPQGLERLLTQNPSGGGLAARADATAAGPFGGDPNRQDGKLGFHDQERRSAALGETLTAPASTFELETGTVIPAVLVSEIDSDLPGDIVAQVSRNVFDTVSGNWLLVPQGTRLYGRYDSHVSYGQDRLLVDWHRLIYPNGYTLELGTMAGHDAEGRGGFEDQVDGHYARVFGWGLLTSLLSAGFALSQPRPDASTFYPVPTNGQVVAGAVGQQLTTLGAQAAARNMDVQPTVRIRKGYRLNVMVNRDIVFPGTYQP